MDRFEPVPVPSGDGRHDIGDDVRAAIVRRLISDWSRDPDLTPEKVRQLAMWAGAAVRSLIHELGTLRDLANGLQGEVRAERASLVAAIRAEVEALLLWYGWVRREDVLRILDKER